MGDGFLALRDRAFDFVRARGVVSEEELLTHVYSGPPPPSLRAQLTAPLLEDPRLERRAGGEWAPSGKQRSATEPPGVERLAVTTLALAATGPSSARARVVRVCALHVQGGALLARFSATVNPGQRVPGYVAERLGLAPEVLDELPPFDSILDDLVRFLDTRPVFVQDARLTWAFIGAEARRAGRVLAEPLLIDANELATRVLAFNGKPSLAAVAAHLGVGTVRITRPEEEARVLGLLAGPLMAMAREQGAGVESLFGSRPERTETAVLRRGQTARSQPDAPGVYVLRDNARSALYVGKASRLRSRLEAYTHRPVGVTRRLEGLVGSVEAVDSTVCATDLEALILEDREIRRLQPRYNTVRQQRTPRLWIRLPPLPTPRPGTRQPASRRLEPSLGPGSADGEFVGPFRNQTIAERTRLLARAVFDLDALRRRDPRQYEERLRLAWHFLRPGGSSASEAAETLARQHSSRLLQAVLAFDPAALLLPADPREARYAVVRPTQTGIEGFLIDRGIFRGWSIVSDDDEPGGFATGLLAAAQTQPRSELEDVDVVLRWLGAQRAPAQLLHLPDGQPPLEEACAIEVAAASARSSRLFQTRTSTVKDPLDPLSRPAPDPNDVL